MAGKFELLMSKNGKYRFNLKAGNNQVIVSSQLYDKRMSATNGIKSVKNHCSDDKCFDRKVAKNGKPYFVLKAKNGQVIGKSQQYASNATMAKGIRAVRNAAPDAEVVDLTK
ncbi:MAG: YegP family protein [Acidobacteriota bacterium]|nr:YegP family protein [Acidobacteriota bacterium]MDH3528249.1 YegP family protein [Acidobacteriota bacterium]